MVPKLLQMTLGAEHIGTVAPSILGLLLPYLLKVVTCAQTWLSLLHPALQVRGLNLSLLHVGVALELIWGVTICPPWDSSRKTPAASGCVGRIARDHWRVKFYLKSFRMGMSGAESEPSPLRGQEEQEVGKRRQEAWAVAIKCIDMFTTELCWLLEAWSRSVLFPLTDPSRAEHSPTRSAQQDSFATSLGCPSQCL